MKTLTAVALVVLLFLAYIVVTQAPSGQSISQQSQISPQTQTCLACHKLYTPGIVEDWQRSLHSQESPASAGKKPDLERRMSAKEVPVHLENVVVGCYECHSLNAEKHQDSFDHFGLRINVIVSPQDCATCHPAEANEYSTSKKAHARGNLEKNPVYHALVETVISQKAVENGEVVQKEASDLTRQETCLGCHGTEVKVNSMREVETKIGKIKVPNLLHWPNQGVGRVNPDGSMGSCAACHPRHAFSIEMARKPYTCAQCHLEPDVPAWNVYKESKHGNIYFSHYQRWDFQAVPWKVGKDFQAPTCATCHNSLITAPDGKTVLAERTHDFGSRLWVRLFGLIYSHPQPKHGDTTIIRNKDGLPLPTTFTGEPASEYLISKEEQAKRESLFKQICQACHSTQWTEKHFAKLDNTVKEVDSMILASTLLLVEAWKDRLAEGLPHGKNPFDETIEQLWVRQWLFYGNSIKYASAMTGAPDYATFKNGWWNLTENLQHMKDWIELKKRSR